MEPATTETKLDLSVSSIRILTLNCWGLKYISKFRSERLSEIGNRIATISPQLDIVGLQECWAFSDYLTIRNRTRSILPYGKFYHSGIFGAGLAILSRWPIRESSMYRYPLNGRPTAFFRGDWFVGKGVACAKIALPDGVNIEVFNTHLHAPYEKEPNDSYICHRTAQAWEIAKLMRAASERGSLVVGLGDFNMVPLSFAHVLIENQGRVQDVWRVLKPESSVGASIDPPEKERRKRVGEDETPTVNTSLQEHGHTCDSVLNTWRWNKADQEALEKGRDRKIPGTDPDPKAKRLDYIFFSGIGKGWNVKDVQVVLTERHSTLRCSLTDHFAVQATLLKGQSSSSTPVRIEVHGALNNSRSEDPLSEVASFEDKDFITAVSKVPTQFQLGKDFYNDILAMIDKYALRERKQRRYRLVHFIGSALFSIGSFIAVWWSPINFVSFILILVSSLGLMAGTVDGLIGGLFVGSELRALAEFEWEVRNALQLTGGPVQEDQALQDWYDK
ncbi:uncharacterized protein A1O9_05087 [Exophiala aquamarina CBS 119918]|uniref:Endonuclease/exonuclease/phosphatase domain-containing protein n=1 Tax=Exophiala aquamarina CBS 119918 TaxID=1182545 RepID=A0A072PKG3_9EURO|nr:uncharacterized protein A1O9_05087 [Exophiala aquamarina CBS 119918]KEF60237.1 hypothetical protein A1O9_05087 [Exophiala aquamarina CBS 119918]